MDKNRIYLDYTATTPVDKEVLEAMLPYFSEEFGNPSSIHRLGQEASATVFRARKAIADTIGADYKEVVFTSSATEANNLALRGISNFQFPISKPPFRLITTAIEHSSILETCKDLERQGVEVVYLPVDKRGFVELKALKKELNERTALVSIGYANGEIGVVQNIRAIAKEITLFRSSLLPHPAGPCHRRWQLTNNEDCFVIPPYRDGIPRNDGIQCSSLRGGRNEMETDKTISRKNSERFGKLGKTQNNLEKTTSSAVKGNLLAMAGGGILPLFHVDAVQAFQFLDCNVDELGIDLMTLSAHKIYGPKGVGALYIRDVKNTPIPIITGGSQEWGMRAGTENVSAIVGFGKAVELTVKNKKKQTKKIAELRNYLWKGIREEIKGARINSGNDIRHLPNILNVYFPGKTAQEMAMELDLRGIAVSPGAACSARSIKPSRVIEALGYKNKDRARNSVRFSLGKWTTKKEIEKFLEILKNIDI